MKLENGDDKPFYELYNRLDALTKEECKHEWEWLVDNWYQCTKCGKRKDEPDKPTYFKHSIIPLKELTEKDFYSLKASGMLWEIYPEAPEFYSEIKKEVERIPVEPTEPKVFYTDYPKCSDCQFDKMYKVLEAELERYKGIVKTLKEKYGKKGVVMNPGSSYLRINTIEALIIDCDLEGGKR